LKVKSLKMRIFCILSKKTSGIPILAPKKNQAAVIPFLLLFRELE